MISDKLCRLQSRRLSTVVTSIFNAPAHAWKCHLFESFGHEDRKLGPGVRCSVARRTPVRLLLCHVSTTIFSTFAIQPCYV